MKKLIMLITVSMFLASIAMAQNPTEEKWARVTVIEAVERNKLGVGGREFLTKPNTQGDGIYVYDPRTRFHGVERYLIWVVIDEEAYPLNSPSKMVTPGLKWPREAKKGVWERTNLDCCSATDSIDMVFNLKK